MSTLSDFLPLFCPIWLQFVGFGQLLEREGDRIKWELVEDDWGLSLAIDIVRKLTLLALCLTYFWEMDRNGPRVGGNQSVAAQKF